MPLPIPTTSVLLPLLSFDTHLWVHVYTHVPAHMHTHSSGQRPPLALLLPTRKAFLTGDILQRQTQAALEGNALFVTKVC